MADGEGGEVGGGGDVEDGGARQVRMGPRQGGLHIGDLARDLLAHFVGACARIQWSVSEPERRQAERHAPNFISSLKPSHDRFMPCTPASTSVPSVRIGLVDAYWLYPDPPASANESLAADSVNDVVSELIACAGSRSGVLKSIGRGLNAGAGGW